MDRILLDFTEDLINTNIPTEFSLFIDFISEYFEELKENKFDTIEEFISFIDLHIQNSDSKDIIERKNYRIINSRLAFLYTLFYPLKRELEKVKFNIAYVKSKDLSLQLQNNFIKLFKKILTSTSELFFEFTSEDYLSFNSIKDIESTLDAVNMDSILNSANSIRVNNQATNVCEKLNIVKLDFKHSEFNSIYLPFYNTIIVSKSKEKNLEYVLLHEIGHYVHHLLAGSLNKMPDDFNISVSTNINDLREIFADLFSVKVMLNTSLENHNPFILFMREDIHLKNAMLYDAEYFSELLKDV